MIEPVIKSIHVPCSPEIAFRIFTKDFGKWWPFESHSMTGEVGQPRPKIYLEPVQGGAIVEIDRDGTRHIWGAVRQIEVNKSLAIDWHVGRGADEATLLEIEFEADGTGTRVTLTHSGWEVLGKDGSDMRGGYHSGWVLVFETCFADACGATLAP